MAMRERRAAHVRPRSPDTERMRTKAIKSPAPPASAMRRYRAVDTGPGIPVPMGMAIGSAVVVIGLIALLIGSGIVVDVAGQLGNAFHDAMGRLTSHPPATAPPSGIALDTPVLDTPVNDGYTSDPKLVLQGNVPSGTVGKSGYKVRVYSFGKNDSSAMAAEVAVGGTTRFTTSTITLVEGPNTFGAVLVSPTGEGSLSPKVTYTLDTKSPAITISSPAQNAQINADTVTIAGKTESDIKMTVRNEMILGGSVTSATSGDDGTFSIQMPIVAGPNTLDLTAVDKAGNSGSTTLTVKRSYGKLAAHLSVSPAKFAGSAKTTLKLTVHATTTSGAPMAGASVVFSVRVVGLGPIDSNEITTDANGTASWQVDIAGASAGNGYATVMVTSPGGDTATDTTAIVTT